MSIDDREKKKHVLLFFEFEKKKEHVFIRTSAVAIVEEISKEQTLPGVLLECLLLKGGKRVRMIFGCNASCCFIL